MLSSHRGVIDSILGDVLVVVARFFATEVVTLRCNLVSDIVASNQSRYESLHPRSKGCGKNRLVPTRRWSRIALTRPAFADFGTTVPRMVRKMKILMEVHPSWVQRRDLRRFRSAKVHPCDFSGRKVSLA